MQQKSFGFTLIELLIVIAIIGILATSAIPSYQKYLRRAHFVEIIQATIPYKMAIEECYQLNGSVKSCPIPNSQFNTKTIKQINVDEQGVITVIPQELHGLKNNDSYILTPTIENEQLIWHSSGGGVDAGYAAAF